MYKKRERFIMTEEEQKEWAEFYVAHMRMGYSAEETSKAHIALLKQKRLNVDPPKRCGMCGALLSKGRIDAEWCSDACRQKGYRERKRWENV